MPQLHPPRYRLLQHFVYRQVPCAGLNVVSHNVEASVSSEIGAQLGAPPPSACSVGWFVSLLVCEEVLLAGLCERKILFRLKIYDRLRQATAKRTDCICVAAHVLCLELAIDVGLGEGGRMEAMLE